MKSNLVDLEVTLHHETEEAVRVSSDGLREHAVWIPKSACEIEPTRSPRIIMITLPEQLAIDKGLV